jgi:hypothetical protein
MGVPADAVPSAVVAAQGLDHLQTEAASLEHQNASDADHGVHPVALAAGL